MGHAPELRTRIGAHGGHGAMFAKMESIDPQFRLFITCLPHKDFLGSRLQMSTKVTNEPPMGLEGWFTVYLHGHRRSRKVRESGNGAVAQVVIWFEFLT